MDSDSWPLYVRGTCLKLFASQVLARCCHFLRKFLGVRTCGGDVLLMGSSATLARIVQGSKS